MAMRRARSAGRNDQADARVTGVPAGNQDLFYRELLQELRQGRQQGPPRETFKVPEYSGVGSIEAFIRQFLDIAEANEWPHRSAVLHLRGALKDKARDCGGPGETLDEIFTALRARFGISPREARGKLNSHEKRK